MTNIYAPDFDEGNEDAPDGFKAICARLGRQAGAQRLGISLWELPPGEAAYPYHYHHEEEELVVVLEGNASLRDPNGWRELAEGDVVSFLTGEVGGHQLANFSEQPVRFLSISTIGTPELCVYPDSGKLGAFDERLGLRALFSSISAVDYWQGERAPERPERT